MKIEKDRIIISKGEFISMLKRLIEYDHEKGNREWYKTMLKEIEM